MYFGGFAESVVMSLIGGTPRAWLCSWKGTANATAPMMSATIGITTPCLRAPGTAMASSAATIAAIPMYADQRKSVSPVR